MNVVYSSSNLYCECTIISLTSLLENIKADTELNVYILGTDISKENLDRFKKLEDNYSCSIVVIDAKDDFIEGAKEYKLELLRGAYNTYSRIMLNKWFNKLDKVVLIDSDTLVTGDVSPMWDIDLEGKLIAAVPEIGVYSKNSTIESDEIINSVNIYYNMGIVVVNLKEWRRQNVDSFLLSSIAKQTEPNLVADQSIINRYLNDYIVRMELKYNFYTPIHGTSYKKISKVFCKKRLFNQEEINEAQSNPIIIHFYGQSYERPWFKRSASKYKKLYLSYRDKTCWRGFKLSKTKKNPSLVFRLYDSFCYFLLKFHLYNTCLHFKYVIGQKIKRKTNMHR